MSWLVGWNPRSTGGEEEALPRRSHAVRERRDEAALVEEPAPNPCRSRFRDGRAGGEELERGDFFLCFFLFVWQTKRKKEEESGEVCVI